MSATVCGDGEFVLAGTFVRRCPSFESIGVALREVIAGPISLVVTGERTIEIRVFSMVDFGDLVRCRFLWVEKGFLELIPIFGDGLACRPFHSSRSSLFEASCEAECRIASSTVLKGDVITPFEPSLVFAVAVDAVPYGVDSLKFGSFSTVDGFVAAAEDLRDVTTLFDPMDGVCGSFVDKAIGLVISSSGVGCSVPVSPVEGDLTTPSSQAVGSSEEGGLVGVIRGVSGVFLFWWLARHCPYVSLLPRAYWASCASGLFVCCERLSVWAVLDVVWVVVSGRGWWVRAGQISVSGNFGYVQFLCGSEYIILVILDCMVVICVSIGTLRRVLPGIASPVFREGMPGHSGIVLSVWITQYDASCVFF